MVLSLGSVRQLMQSCCLGQRLQQQFGAVCQRAAQQAQQQQLGSRSSRHFAAQPARALEQSLCCVDRSLTAFRFAPLAMAMNKRVGFMGAGQMAEALARGLIDKGVIEPANICCSDPTPSRKELFRSLGATPFDTNLEVAKNSNVLFVSVKPQYVHQVLSEARDSLSDGTLVISIAAGITVAQLLDAAGPNARVCRVMPNTPCLVGETAAAMCLGGKASAEDADVVVSLFSAVGKIYQLEEKLLSAVTGLSGSGPAYVYMMIEALADGGVRAGLPRDVAQGLAAQTVLGSAKMVLETGRHPGALKDMVTSPGGTTIAGVHELEKAGLRAACMNAVVAATQRANELSKG